MQHNRVSRSAATLLFHFCLRRRLLPLGRRSSFCLAFDPAWQSAVSGAGAHYSRQAVPDPEAITGRRSISSLAQSLPREMRPWNIMGTEAKTTPITLSIKVGTRIADRDAVEIQQISSPSLTHSIHLCVILVAKCGSLPHGNPKHPCSRLAHPVMPRRLRPGVIDVL